MIIHDERGNALTNFVTDEDGNPALPVMQKSNIKQVVLDVQNLAAAQNFLVISLGNTTQWKHILTNCIHVDRFGINVNPSSSYRGDVSLGFLSNSSATKADFNYLKTYHFDQAGNGLQAFLNLNGANWKLSKTTWFGPTDSNDTGFGFTRVLIGPDGYNHFGTYDGDMVMKVTRTAGNVDIGLVVGYHTT